MIETARLLIRAFRPEDAGDLHEYLSDETTYRFEPGSPIGPEAGFSGRMATACRSGSTVMPTASLPASERGKP